jgi:2-phosphosulfolactate phosphatase
VTDVSLHWGATGAPESGCAVVVDVLSFSTTLTVAIDQGIEVLPYRWKDARAAAFARKRSAALAVGRGEQGSSGVSLSPGSVRRSHGVERLVLPSPNGSTISHQLGAVRGVVVGGCLRNATAVARWVEGRSPDAVTVVAAGERWPDGSLRPALEDLLGAGAIIEAMTPDVVLDGDAYAARAAFREARQHLLDRLMASPSGQELVAAGFGDDVVIAAELDASTSVPLLDGDRFRPA